MTIERLESPCGHDSKYPKDVYIKAKLLTVLKIKAKIILTLMPKFKKFMKNIFMKLRKTNTGRQNFYTKLLDLHYFFYNSTKCMLGLHCIYLRRLCGCIISNLNASHCCPIQVKQF